MGDAGGPFVAPPPPPPPPPPPAGARLGASRCWLLMLSVLCLPFALFNTAATMMEDPALPRHHLTVRLHSAQLDTPAPLLERQEQQQQLVCVAEIERFGRLRAEACASSSAEAILCEFEEVRQ